MKPYYARKNVTLYNAHALEALRAMNDESVQVCVTSPPYWGLRDYGVAGQMGLERTPEQYVASMVAVFAEVRRVLRADGTLWVNLGDSYAAHPGQRKMTDKVGAKQETNTGSNSTGSRSVDGLKPKDLVGIPWRVAFALQADGWYLRSDIIWHKPNPMPESVTDRPTKSHEYLFLLSKSVRYYYDAAAVKEPLKADTLARYERGRGENPKYRGGGPGNQTIARTLDHMRRSGNKERRLDTPTRRNDHQATGIPWEDNGTGRNRRTVWEIPTKSYSGAHFATYPPKLVEPCILAGSRPGDVVLDPFNGAGTTGLVASEHGRLYRGIELSSAYCDLTIDRLHKTAAIAARRAA
jgi:DNA modification methylase